MAVPVVTKPADQTGIKDVAITPLQLVATNPPITEWKVTGLPAGLSCSEGGLITGKPSGGEESATVKVKAVNGSGESAEVDFVFHVELQVNDLFWIANPTRSLIEANGVEVPAQTLKLFQFGAEPAEGDTLAKLISQGCAVVTGSLTNNSGHAQLDSVIDTATTLAEKGAQLVLEQLRIRESAGNDPFADYGA